MMADPSDLFWDLAGGMLGSEGVTKGTMMGFPCLRYEGAFFASADHRTGDLIVKVSRERVQELVESGAGQPFAPAGRVFKEWVLFDDRDRDKWSRMLGEALDFAQSAT